jgi:hypothetical protein
MTGVIHAYELSSAGVENRFGWAAAPPFALAYALGAVWLIGMHFLTAARQSGPNQEIPVGDLAPPSAA